ncbi:MAG: hypothetical protein NC305_11865 [Lachnospiraceae bacterium]|nr:hypothetical protein [Lachnospiraceae bacterium]
MTEKEMMQRNIEDHSRIQRYILLAFPQKCSCLLIPVRGHFKTGGNTNAATKTNVHPHGERNGERKITRHFKHITDGSARGGDTGNADLH